MARNKMEILLSARDEATKKIRVLKGVMGSTASAIKKAWLPVTVAVLATVVAIKKLTDAYINVNKALIKASNISEQFEVRLTTLLGSVEEGNQVFKDMAQLAGEVPKTYEEIMASATDLSAVVRGGTEEIKKLMPIIVDISSATGMSVQEVNGQIIRMYSAGAAAADMFRERGVSAALGFQAGVSYTAKETMDTLIQQWEDGTGKFVGASDALAKTFSGMTSMMEDAWFNFKVQIGKELFKQVKTDLQVVLNLINKSKEEGGEYNTVIKETADFFSEAYENAKDFVVAVLVGTAQGVDAFNELIYQLERFQNLIQGAAIGAQELGIRFAEMTTLGLANTEIMQQALKNMQAELAEGIQQEFDARKRANTDYSTILEEKIQALKKVLEQEVKLVKDAEGKKTKIIGKENQKQSAEQAATDKKRVEAKRKVDQEFVSMFKETLTMAAQESRTFAILLQVYNIAETIMNTATAVMKTMAVYGGTPWGIAMAAAVSAMGAAQVGIIASQGFAEGTDSVPAKVAPGEMIFPRTMADAIRAGDIAVSGRGGFGGGGIQIFVEVNNPVVRSDEDIDVLVEEISTKLAQEAERI